MGYCPSRLFLDLGEIRVFEFWGEYGRKAETNRGVSITVTVKGLPLVSWDWEGLAVVGRGHPSYH
jgi:hypothetical protein